MGDERDESVEFDGIIERETERAFLIDTGRDKVWLPKSQIREQSDPNVDKIITWTIPLWLAEADGLI